MEASRSPAESYLRTFYDDEAPPFASDVIIIRETEDFFAERCGPIVHHATLIRFLDSIGAARPKTQKWIRSTADRNAKERIAIIQNHERWKETD